MPTRVNTPPPTVKSVVGRVSAVTGIRAVVGNALSVEIRVGKSVGDGLTVAERVALLVGVKITPPTLPPDPTPPTLVGKAVGIPAEGIPVAVGNKVIVGVTGTFILTCAEPAD
jgi:hypothetical protein